jgi:hypothetical protein
MSGGLRISTDPPPPPPLPVSSGASSPPPPATAPGRFPAQRPIQPKPKRGKDGWAKDETDLNKKGVLIMGIPAVAAAMLSWGILGIEVPAAILWIVVAICGVAGGVVNIYGRGPIWAGAMTGMVMALGAYAAVFFWLEGRRSVRSYEILAAFVIGALPGWGLQWLLQKLLRKQIEAAA